MPAEYEIKKALGFCKMNLYTIALRLAAKTFIVKEKVENEVQVLRWPICEGCPKRDTKENKCTVCGCFLDLKIESKINWNAKRFRNEITHCPLGKWNDIETANLYRAMDGKELLTT